MFNCVAVFVSFRGVYFLGCLFSNISFCCNRGALEVMLPRFNFSRLCSRPIPKPQRFLIQQLLMKGFLVLDFKKKIGGMLFVVLSVIHI